ncbi:hypothetical protein CANINC_004016 [Pichia inconspicua]|uniref:Peptidase A1 domain-containing protein n=1 Tax=Pichia inconspicua TaxID=52247 RepID=A0A4T0WYN1_9ASCO|nr:hypothetical protein CANINC_004016 [[Candida] inconspicua]
MLGLNTLIACLISLGAITNAAGAVPAQLSIVKRADSQTTLADELSIDENDNAFVIGVEVGSNNFPLSLIVDTSSDDTWIPSHSYSSNSSSSFETQSTSEINVDGTTVDVTSGTDTIHISGQELNDFPLFIADVSKDTVYGRLGLGYGNNSTPIKLANANIIARPAYSLNFNPQDGSQIIFGGVDKDQLGGPLVQFKNVALQTDSDDLTAVAVSLGKLTYQNGNGDLITIGEGYLPLELDSSSTDVLLPKPLFDAFASSIGLDESNSVSCDDIRSSYFMFAIQQQVYTITATSFFTEEDGKCVFQALSTEGNHPIFGLTLLQNLYTVVDLEAKSVGLSIFKYSSSSSLQVIDGGKLPGSIYPPTNDVFDENNDVFTYFTNGKSATTVTYANDATSTVKPTHSTPTLGSTRLSGNSMGGPSGSHAASHTADESAPAPTTLVSSTASAKPSSSASKSSTKNGADSLKVAGMAGLLPFVFGLI